MVLESTMVCVDSSEFMRNGDYLPTRLQAQQDAVSLICNAKTRTNSENNVGLVTMTKGEVLVTLTTDVGHILSKLHQVQPDGLTNLSVGIRVAHLALKHRLSKNHKMRIIAFIGSPIKMEDKEIVTMAKRLKKEKVNVDIVNFGEEAENETKLNLLIDTLNGKDGTSSHLVTVSQGSQLSDALLSSPVVQGEDGTAAPGLGMAGGSSFEFGVDPNTDPELALALRVSMEEQRARQEAEAREQGIQLPTDAGRQAAAATAGRTAAAGGGTAPTDGVPTSMDTTTSGKNDEEAMLEQALAMSMQVDGDGVASSAAIGQATPSPSTIPDFNMMTEEEQIEYAMRMSMTPMSAADVPDDDDDEETMDVEEKVSAESASSADKKKEEEPSVVADPDYLLSVAGNLPGVDQNVDQKKSATTENPQENKEDKEKKK